MGRSLPVRPGWLVGAILVACAASLRAAGGPEAPANLRCEYRVDPIGIDVRAPRLSWWVRDARRGARQAAYQVLVATSPANLRRGRAAAWDSGRVASEKSVHVVYAGKPLRSGRRYWWKVRTWDRGGSPSPWSQPAFWETGLLSPSDWQARWITIVHPESVEKELPLAGARWIWHGGARRDNARICVRKAFDVPSRAAVAKATAWMTCDNAFTLYLNGRKVGGSNDWEIARTYQVAGLLRDGRNILAVEARNDDGPCGLLGKLRIETRSGKVTDLPSGAGWRTSEKAQGNWKAGEAGDSPWAKAVVVAAYGDEPWHYVTGAATPPTRRALCFRKEFRLAGRVARARAYVSGLGIYELRLNGKRVGKDVFAPGWTYYDRRVQYQTYDVTELVKPGANAIGAMVGSGWWNGMHGRGREKPRLICQLVVELADGKVVRIVTDATWKAHVSPALEDSFYHGETYDARLEQAGWDAPGFREASWRPVEVLDEKPGRLVAQQAPTMQVTAELPAVEVAEPTKGAFVYDFGQNASGRCRLTVRRARPGARITLRHAEVLKGPLAQHAGSSDGTIYTANYRSARATDVYLCKGEPVEVWEPRFTYRGFRYAELTGYPGRPPKDALVHRVLHSAAPAAGTFACSSEVLTRFWRNVTWTQRSNLHSVPTDCPQRDERFGWTGDAQLFAATSCWNMDMAAFYTKWLGDMISGGNRGGVVQGWGPAWVDATTILPWTMYRFYGDRRILRECYPRMVALVEGRRKRSRDHIYVEQAFGDWIAVVKSPTEPICSAYHYHSVKLLGQMAAALGRADDARKYADLAAKIAAAFDATYRSKAHNTYPGGTQASMVLPLRFGLVPKEHRQAVLANLVADIRRRGGHLSTGTVASAYLLPVLTDAGEHEAAYRLASRTTRPSWGYMVRAGATTVWELWNSDAAGPLMNSRNHFALGAVGQWYFEALAGISPDIRQPGFQHVVIRPRPAGDLTWARAEYPSMYGVIRSAWRIEGGRFTLDLTIPANATATVYVPTREPAAVVEGGRPAAKARGVMPLRAEPHAAVFQVGAGTYRFSAPR